MPAISSVIGSFLEHPTLGYVQPFGFASIEHPDGESGRFQALIDTGASITLIAELYAQKMLRMSVAEIEKSTSLMRLDAIGGGSQKAYGFKRTLRLRAQDSDANYIALPESWFFVVKSTLEGFPIMLGQFTGFQERWLGHYNHPRGRMWQLM